MKAPTVVLLFLAAALSPSLAVATDAPLPQEKVVEILTELATQLGETEASCDKVASTLAKWTEEHREELVELAHATRDATLDGPTQARLDTQLSPALETIFVSAMTCSEHDPTQEALAQIDSLIAGGE